MTPGSACATSLRVRSRFRERLGLLTLRLGHPCEINYALGSFCLYPTLIPPRRRASLKLLPPAAFGPNSTESDWNVTSTWRSPFARIRRRYFLYSQPQAPRPLRFPPAFMLHVRFEQGPPGHASPLQNRPPSLASLSRRQAASFLSVAAAIGFVSPICAAYPPAPLAAQPVPKYRHSPATAFNPSPAPSSSYNWRETCVPWK